MWNNIIQHVIIYFEIKPTCRTFFKKITISYLASQKVNAVLKYIYGNWHEYMTNFFLRINSSLFSNLESIWGLFSLLSLIFSSVRNIHVNSQLYENVTLNNIRYILTGLWVLLNKILIIVRILWKPIFHPESDLVKTVLNILNLSLFVKRCGL